MKASFLVLLAAFFVCATATWDYPKKPYYPPKYPTLRKLVSKSNKFDILVYLLKYTDLFDFVAKTKGLTIFAPTDAAFYRSVEEAGCKTGRSDSKTIKCIKSLISFKQLVDVLTYHVIGEELPSKKVLKKDTFYALNKKYFYRKGLTLIDLAPNFKNPELVKSLLDIKYDKGIVHGIDRVLIPFPLSPPSPPKPDACDLIKKKIYYSKKYYILLSKLKYVVKKCSKVRKAIKKCNYKDVCYKGDGKYYIVRGITVGDAVAAVYKCSSVVKAIYKCSYYY